MPDVFGPKIIYHHLNTYPCLAKYRQPLILNSRLALAKTTKNR